MLRSKALLLVLAAHVIALVAIRPASPWEFDEPLFFQALHRYDPIAHHPPPPGYPVFVFFGRLVRLLIPSDFGALVAISVLASAIGFLMLALAMGEISGSRTVGLAAASLFYFSPAMLVHSTLPISEAGALALLIAGLYCSTKAAPFGAALLYALAIGWRIQFAIFVVPLFLAQVIFVWRGRDRAIAAAVFAAVCLAWLVPLAVAVGGVDELIAFETGQGKYLAAHDAAESRTDWTWPRIAFRFVAHPWGPKWLSFPLLLVALIGAARHARPLLPLGIAGVVYIAFALLFMDPADGVRYAIPFVLVTACAAGMALRQFAPAAALFACAALVYTGPFLWQRSTSESPPVRAARYAQANMPRSAVALYDLTLWPHATYYLPSHRPLRIQDGLAQYFDRPDVPLFIYAEGPPAGGEGVVFEWKNSDAYGKLTRNHYRVVSIEPLPPERRMRIVRGVSPIERAVGEEPWRWLAPVAELQLPRGGARSVTLRLGLPRKFPPGSNLVTILVDGAPARTVTLRSEERADVTLLVPAGSPVIRFEARRAYVPAEIPGSLNYDRRRLSVMLLDLKSSSADAVALPKAASQ